MNITTGPGVISHRSARHSSSHLFSAVWRISTALCLIASFCFAGCANPAQPAVPGPQPIGPGRVVLGEGDVVKLFFPGAAEFNTSQKVRMDGKLSLPIVGETQAAGKTLSAFQAELSARYKSQLTNSEVVVSLEASGKPVIVSGAVVTPGKIVLERQTTLLDAIEGAGGFKDFARKKKVRLTRSVNGRYQTQIYDMSNPENPPYVPLQGGDIINVPLSNW